MKFAEFDQYSEDMLMAQYDISEIISHELMKGEVREDFLISTLESCSEPKPFLVKGTLSDGAADAGLPVPGGGGNQRAGARILAA